MAFVSSNTIEDLSSEPVSRAEGIENRRRAIENGHRFYVGPACKHGHGGRRYTDPKLKAQTGGCVECVRKRQRTYMRKHHRTPEYKARKWEYNQRRREERAELSEDGGFTFLGSPCGKCGGTRYYVSDGTCVLCRQEHYHRGRRALEESWEDTWDTADWLKASALHEEAAALSRRTGVPHVVDHIVPLAKDGAHHPDNMQIIFAGENSAKGAKDWAEEDPLAWLLGG